MHIKVKVWASAGKEAIKKTGEYHYEVFVRQPAKEGGANRRVQQLVAEDLGLEPRALRLISGFQRPNKIFQIIPQKEG